MRLAESVYPIIKVYSAGSNLQSSDHRPSTPLKRPPWVVLPGGWHQSFLSYPKKLNHVLQRLLPSKKPQISCLMTVNA